MLLTLPDVLAPDQLGHARDLLASAPWADGRSTAGVQAAQVKNNEQLPPSCSQSQALQSMVLAALERHPLFLSAALPKRVLPPLFNRYSGSANAYGSHVDQAIRYAGEGSQRLRADLSCTLFLNDPADYDGGELVIDAAGGASRFKLPAGHLLLYPASHVHRVEPVTRGARLASFFWVECLVRSEEQRRLLFDLDMNLMTLRQRHGESAEAIALTGTYHNLLRMWADT